MLEFKYDTQLLIEGENLDEDEISEYFTEHFKGDCLLAVGDDELIKIHFHTNEPWKVLEYCSVQRLEGLRRKRELSVLVKNGQFFCEKYSLRPLPNLIYW